MAVARAEDIINADLFATDVRLEDLGLESLEPVLALLERMPRLKKLSLARNKLTGLPSDLSGIRRLECLDISSNPITGLAAIRHGLYSIAMLKHLHVDLPLESEEDDIIVALRSLESLNGTSLLEAFNDARCAGEGGEEEDSDVSPKPRINEAVSLLVQEEELLRKQHQQQESHCPSCFHWWGSEDTAQIQELCALVTKVSGSTFNQQEFAAHVARVAQHLGAPTAGETDTAHSEGEMLRAKVFLYDYCLAELCRVAGQKDAVLGHALSAVVRAQADVMGRYDRLWRCISGDMNERVAVMKQDMQDAIHEIESLMGRLGEASDGNNHVAAAAGTTFVANDSQLQRLQEEVGRLRTENERLQTRLRLVEASGCGSGLSPDATSTVRRSVVSAERSQRLPSRSQAPQLGGKVLTLKQLKRAIEDIYVSKSKYDIKCSESKLPRETMEQHMYTYLNQRYGLKHIILDWATAIIQGVKKYALEDNDVMVFGKILRNEIDEEFRFVQRQVRETVHDLLRVYVKSKRPSRSDSDINNLVRAKMNSTLQEDEWVDIVKYMYNAEDAVEIIIRVRDHIRQISLLQRRGSLQRGRESSVGDAVQLPYADFVRILLDFQLEGHERFLFRFFAVFSRHDTDRNGIVNAREFAAILKSVDPSKTDDDVDAVLELIDPFGNQLITYSECVTYLSAEIVRMKAAE